MHSKGAKTRQEIIERVARLFNEKGYASASMSDITAATGIERGGIYNHFESKEQLAEESFAYACGLVGEALRRAVGATDDPAERLKGIATVFAELYAAESAFPNGCPVLNTAVEAKGPMTPLRRRAREAMTGLRTLVASTVEQGKARGRLRVAIDADEVATVFVAALEGAMLLSMLYEDDVHLARAVRHLHGYVDAALRAEAGSGGDVT